MKLSHLKTTPAATDPETVQARWICVFLALAVFAVFGQAAHFEFVNYDDAQNVYENPVVTKGLSVEAAGWAFTHAQLSSWVPLTTLSHMLDCQLFALDAGEHHLVNVVLHAANVVLLFLVVRQLTGSLWRSAFVAALFAFHPLRSESVAWVSERKDVLSGFFFLLSVGAYVRWVRQRSCAGHVGLVLLFALGLLAKSMVATLPFVLLLLDYWPLRRWGNANQVAGLVREKIPLFVLSAGACLAAVLAPGLLVTASRRLPLLERVGNAVVSYAVYVEQMFFPVGLATPYPIPSAGQPAWKIGLASLLLAGITTGAVAFRKSRPWLLTGWLWYLGMLFPVIGLLQISPDAAHADRYTYLPEIGLAIGATWALADWCGSLKRARATLGGLMIGVISGLCICGYVQTSYWHDDESLWLRALACTSGNYVAHYNLGNALVKHGELDEAVAQFQKSVEIQPDLFKPHYNLANALFKQGRFDDAIIQYRKALEIEPDNVEALNNLGNALAMTGADAKAIAEYQKAVALQPNYSDARCDLGHVLLKLGRLDEAVAQFQQAVAIKPDDPDLRNDLGKSLLMKNDFDGAMSCFEKTTPMSPDPLVRWRLVGDNFLKQEDWDAAIICYRQAISIDPHSANTCANLGMACFQKGEAREAIESWEKSLAINPDQLTVENNLAWLLATTSDPALRNGTRAVALAVQANESGGGGNPVILHTLAVAYAAQGSYGQAATTARRALQLALDQKRSALAATLQKEITDYETHPAPGSSRP